MRCPDCLRKITVEPVVFLALFSVSLLEPLSQKYIYEKLKTNSGRTSQKNVTFLPLNQSHSCFNQTEHHIDDNELKAKAAKWLLYLHLAAQVPAIITSLLLGIWSDKSGRKIALIISLFGSLVQVSVYIIVVHLDLSILVLLGGNILFGITGYLTVTIATCMAYVADITSKQERTIRIVIISTVMGLSSGLAELISGYWLRDYGYKPPFWLIFGCQIVNIIYVLVFVKETIIRDRAVSIFDCKLYLSQFCRLFSKSRRRWYLAMYMASFFITELVLAGLEGLLMLYSMRWPFCFNQIHIGFLSAALMGAYSTSLFGVKMLQLVSWCTNHWIIEIGLLSAVAGLVLAGFARTTLMLFMVPVAAMFAFMPLSVLRACMSRVVDFHEQGFLFAVVGCVHSIAMVTGHIVFNTVYIYSSTQHTFGIKGMTFLLEACLLVLPGLLIGITQFYQGYNSYSVFVDSLTSCDDDSSSDSDESVTVPILSKNGSSGNSLYQSCGT